MSDACICPLLETLPIAVNKRDLLNLMGNYTQVACESSGNYSSLESRPPSLLLHFYSRMQVSDVQETRAGCVASRQRHLLALSTHVMMLCSIAAPRSSLLGRLKRGHRDPVCRRSLAAAAMHFLLYRRETKPLRARRENGKEAIEPLAHLEI